MTKAVWSLVEIAARMLEPADREAVLGDLLEAGEGGWTSLWAVIGLAFRRQLLLWKSWRPWLAGFGIAVPSCYLLMGVSGSVTCTYERLHRPGTWVAHWPTGHEDVPLLLCHVFLLVAWSWTSGFAYGSLARSSVWTSAMLCLFPSFWANIHIDPLPRLWLFLFLLPAFLGVREGLRTVRIKPVAAFALAIGITGLMTFAWNREALWIFNWALAVPVWYLVATAHVPPLRSAAILR